MDENKIECDYCYKIFKSFKNLEYHFENLVCQKYDYACKVCKKDFHTKQRLKKHQNSNTMCNNIINNNFKKEIKNYLYECCKCGKRYTTESI